MDFIYKDIKYRAVEGVTGNFQLQIISPQGIPSHLFNFKIAPQDMPMQASYITMLIQGYEAGKGQGDYIGRAKLINEFKTMFQLHPGQFP